MWGLGDAIFSGTVPLVSKYSFMFTLELSHSKRIFYPPTPFARILFQQHLFPRRGFPYIVNSRFKTFEEYLDSLVIEEDQKFLKDVDTARVIAQLGYRFDMVTLDCDLIPQVWHDILNCNLIPQVFRQNTLRGGVPTAEGRNRCFKKLWQGS